MADIPQRLTDILGDETFLAGAVWELFPNTYELSFPLDRGTGVQELNLGNLGPSVTGAVRLTRQKVYWIFPTISTDLPPDIDTQLLLLQTRDHGVAALLPLTTQHYMGNFRGADDATIALRVDKEAEDCSSASIVVAFAEDVKSAVREVVLAARQVLYPGTENQDFAPEKHVFTDTLTYCTWNSLQPPTPATSTNALKTLQYFASNNIHPTTFLIDDAWQDFKNYRLRSFFSTPAFLDGMVNLGELVFEAKDTYGVVNVGAWHTIQGYWCGVEPSMFIDRYRLIKVTKDGYPGPFEPEGFSYYIPHPDDVGAFFDAYYEVLASYGVTFTKCDNMASLDNLVRAVEVESYVADDDEILGDAVDVASIRPAFKNAVKAAAKKWFGSSEGGRVIWCMEMSPRVLLGEEIGLPQSSETRAVIRNSDDYYPDQPDSHRYHIFTNAVNALFTSQLNVVPDLDMFQSHPYIRPHGANEQREVLASDNYPQAAFHAALRALGAGPVTLTDVPGKTDPKILNKLIGTAQRGARSVALQASCSPFVSNDVFDQSILEGGTGRAFRVFSRREQGDGERGGVVGLWNIRSNDGRVEDVLRITDVRTLVGTHATGQFAVYSHKTHLLRIVDMSNGTAGILSPVRLEPFQFDLITVAPLERNASLQDNLLEVAALGLIDKYNSLAAVVSGRFVNLLATDSLCYEAIIKCAGKLAFYVRRSGPSLEAVTAKVWVDGQRVEPRMLTVAKGEMLTVDLEPLLLGRDVEDPFVVRLEFEGR